MEQLWRQLLTVLEGGELQSDPTYYSEGEAQPGEWANVIEKMFERTEPGSAERSEIVDILDQMGFWADTDDLDFWKNQEVNDLDKQDLANAAEQRLPNLREQDAGGGVTTQPNAPAEEEQAEEGVGGGGDDPQTQLTILTGNQMQWYFDPNQGRWYVGYGLPNSNRELVFEADPDQMDSLFGDGMRPSSYERASFADLTARSGVSFAGNIAEMEGTGSFESEYDKVISLALDEGSLPSWMEGSAAATDALFVAQTEGKSNDWLMEQWQKLPEFQARFPNIEQIRKEGNLTLPEAVKGFLEYEASLKQAVAAFGLDENAVTPEVIGGLIDGGYSVKTAQDVIKAYDRMEEYAPAMEAFNQILAANGMDPITDLQGMFDFVNGNAPDTYYDLYEASSLQEAAVQAGLGDVFSAQDAVDAALQGQHTLDTAMQSMQQAAKLALRLRGEIDLGQFDLTQEELIDLSLGQNPDTGRTQAELQEVINRMTLTARQQLQRRSRPFTGFTQSGRPQQRSLGGLRQQT